MPDRFPVWDLPTRLFHWLLVVCVALAWWSGEEGNFEVHEWTGYSIVVLVGFRLVWGVIGSPHSRFADFIARPRRVLGYLRGEVESGPGHNPLGGWSVAAILALLLLQGASGLFNSDDAQFKGPYYHAVSVGFRDTMGELHEIAFNLLCALIVLHVGAVLYYQLRRRQPLLQAMWRGDAEGKEGRGAPASRWLAAMVVAVVAGLLWALISAAPEPLLPW